MHELPPDEGPSNNSSMFLGAPAHLALNWSRAYTPELRTQAVQDFGLAKPAAQNKDNIVYAGLPESYAKRDFQQRRTCKAEVKAMLHSACALQKSLQCPEVGDVFRGFAYRLQLPRLAGLLQKQHKASCQKLYRLGSIL